MGMQRKARLLEISALVGVILLAAACHKNTPVATTPAPPPSEATPPPTPRPPKCTLTPSPATVTLGQAITLNWTSSDATGVVLNPDLGQQEAQGATSVTPAASTTYSLSLTGPGGSGECSARVTVTPAIPSPPSVSESNLGPGGGAAGASAGANALQDAFFDFNKADLRPDAQKALTQDAAYLKAHPDAKIQIGGFCDQRGSEEYNLGLGERRAESAKNFLVNLGISPDRINTISFGKDRLFCTDATEDCYQQNRRAQPVVANQ
jgi:peptidoglycan-associated lipoprotein